MTEDKAKGMKLRMELGERSYDIVLKQGSLGNARRLANFDRRVLIVTDRGVPAKYVKTVAGQCKEPHVFKVAGGEASKSVEVWRDALAFMLDKGFARGDAVAAVGGGVVGDLAGYVAAAYMRGVSFFQFPTTTLAQIDSSIGGKVGINLGGSKNIVGAFHQPELVIVDPATLETLPRRHFANGLAEALKTGLIGSTELFELLEMGLAHQEIEQVLFLCLRYKKSVVERDETEKGERRLLNFGHTIGHGIEAVCGMERAWENAGGQGEEFGTPAGNSHKATSPSTAGKLPKGLLHGECVALGMLPMIENKTLARRTRAVMKQLGLPLKSGCDKEAVLAHIRHDKKRQGDLYNVVRIQKLGQAYQEQVDFEELRRLVEAMS